MVDPSAYDFGGYATRYNTLCSDGRKILPGAFKHSDGAKLPLVWQHLHNEPKNVLGHVVLEHRDDGVYVYGKFNETDGGKQAKTLVHAKDIVAMSIYANQLVEKSKIVHAGNIREVSLVLSGANPGAKIDHLNLEHADGTEEEIEDEAIITSGEDLDLDLKQSEEVAEEETAEESEEAEELVHADGEKTVGDVVDSMTEEQKEVMYAIIAAALEEGSSMSQSDEEGDNFMKKNAFDGNSESSEKVLSHAERAEFMHNVFESAKKGGSLREAVLEHAGTYGIDDIGFLFPDAKAVTDTPDWLKRDTTWVNGWLGGTTHRPFSRIKSWYADVTADEARAKGYITGNQKLDEVFPILKRTTDPTTVYKKQKLDRDDILDITDFNVVAWMKQEMRFMLDEEIGRASLVGDGRTFGVDDDAIDPSKIRPIYGDNVIYSHLLTLEAAVVDYDDIIDAIIAARVNYKGTGTPNFYTTNAVLTGMLLLKDSTGRRIYRNVSELASELRVANIYEVEVLEGVQRSDPTPFTADLLGIFVNPRDYTFGTDRGGEIGLFDDFDIDYNQYKYLIETRTSGALTRVKSALCVERKTA